MEFFENKVNLAAINSSYIVLVPKISSPITASDFRPISLLNCCVKLLTKLLTERLQLIILKIIHKNKYSFIRSRTIQDCLAWSFEYIHQCQQSKRKIVIVKLDFAKAFDTIEHYVILEMLEKLNFPPKWISWVATILSSGTTSVLLNGVLGKSFACKRGVRQGDPLSPLLFVLAAEVLQYIINGLKDKGILKLHIPQPTSDFLIVQYADDMLLILQADAKQLFCLKALLHSFALSTGLKVNYHKSCLIPVNVNVPEEKIPLLTGVFGCVVGELPFTYVGLPLGTTNPLVKDFAPLICRIERKLSASSTFLSYLGRLQLVNSVILSLPTYYMCTLKLPNTVLDVIDKFRKNSLWRGTDVNAKEYNLSAWEMVIVPKDKGGLGAKNLKLQNECYCRSI